MIYRLENPKQAHALIASLWVKIKTALESGQNLTLEVKKESKTRDQEEKYHAMIADIAKQAQHQGARWNAEDWKRLLLHEFAKQANLPQGRIVASLDGTGIVQLGLQSRKLTKDQGSEFIEFLFAWAAQNGVDLT
jgi:hypothetical protein